MSVDDLELWLKLWQKFDIEGIICSTRTDGEWKILLQCFEVIEGQHPAHTSRQVAQQLLGPASWQCSGTCVARGAAVFGFYEYKSSPPYLLTRPNPLWFFPIPKNEIENQRVTLDSIEEIQTKLQNVMKTLTRNDFQKCFQSWKSRWNLCINAKVDYYEGGGGE
jgi:hypothetical protein